jgi:phosphoesterase RecJ-like protein
MNISKTIYTDIVKNLKQAKKVIITTHSNPDGDAIGSALAVLLYLRFYNIDSHIIINDDVPKNLTYLKSSELIEQYNPQRHDNIIKSADTIVVVDLNDVNRTRNMVRILTDSKAFKIVIDHHTNPKDFANLYCVDTTYSSTGQLIYDIFSTDESFILDLNGAEAIYTAIVTDTGNFAYQRTTSDVHRIVANLLDIGVDPNKIYDLIYNQNSHKVIKLLGIALSKLQLHFGGKVCFMVLTNEDFANTGTSYKDTEFFVNRTLSIDGVIIGALITEVIQLNEIKISLRSKGKTDISIIANSMGGGGHINAAGASVKSSNIESVVSGLMNQLSRYFENNNQQ